MHVGPRLSDWRYTVGCSRVRKAPTHGRGARGLALIVKPARRGSTGPVSSRRLCAGALGHGPDEALTLMRATHGPYPLPNDLFAERVPQPIREEA